MAMGPIHKTFLVLRPSKGALTCSILKTGTQLMLRKTYYLRRESWLRPEFWTPRPISIIGFKIIFNYHHLYIVALLLF
jgi:hypothetical protein